MLMRWLLRVLMRLPLQGSSWSCFCEPASPMSSNADFEQDDIRHFFDTFGGY